MNEDAAVWFLDGDDNQPEGPYPAADLLSGLRHGQLSAKRLCWRRGMTDWQTVAEVEPFAGALAAQKAAAKGRVMRIAIAVIVVVCLAAGGIAAYFVVVGPPEVRRGRKLLSAGLYAEASAAVAPYVAREPLDNKARYLLAIAQINEYAVAPGDGGLGVNFVPMRAMLEQGKQNLRRVLANDPGWRQAAADDLAAAAARIPPGGDSVLARMLAVARLRVELNLADKVELAAELMGQWASLGGESGRGALRNEAVVLQILEWDPSLGERIVGRAVGGISGSELELRQALSTLERWAGQRPALAPFVASQLWEKTESLYQVGRHAEAKTVLSKALGVDPEGAATEARALLCIRLTDPDDAKLTRCQYFLKQWPESQALAEVLMVTVKDATTVSERYGSWRRVQAGPYLAAGRDAAERLIREFPTLEQLDAEAYKLAERLAANKQFDEATGLMSALLEAIPDSAVRLQVANSVAQWRQQGGKGTLDPEFDTLAQDVERSLKIMTVSAGGAVRALVDAPGAVHVVRIADGCTLDGFNSEEKDILRRWAGSGGILWVNNNVLSLFGIQYSRRGWYRSGECQPAVVAQICPILAGCRSVEVSASQAAIDLKCQGVVQLLTTGRAGNQECCWSLVPYGKGWVSDVKTVDTAKGDGARFWLNFRLFCLGRPIPGTPVPDRSVRPSISDITETAPPDASVSELAPIVTPTSTPVEPTRITDTDGLEEALVTPPDVLWVALSRTAAGTGNIKRLRDWTGAGGVLWVETDLAEAFGLGDVRGTPSQLLRGHAKVAAISHAILEGFQGQTVRYEASPTGGVISGSQQEIFSATSKVMPLLVRFDQARRRGRATTIAHVVCGVRRYGQGHVLFRPAQIDATGSVGGRFEQRLLSFSREVASP